MPVLFIIVFALPALGGAAPQKETPESELLSDSELVCAVSGGIAGIVRTATLSARSDHVMAEYASNEIPGGGPSRAPLEKARYLELWKEAERAGIWTLQVPGKEEGADLIYHSLTVRVGGRRHSISWTEGGGSTDATRIGERIVSLAREAAALR
jgi:hypothetical protein